MRSIQIDKVRLYLEEGYHLSISTNYLTDKCEGALLIMFDGKVQAIKEVDVNEFMNYFPNLKNNLISKICTVKYDGQKRKIVNSVKHKVLSGAYGEDSSFQVFDDLEVETDDVFTSFIYQEEKIKNYIEKNNGQVMKKERKYEK